MGALSNDSHQLDDGLIKLLRDVTLRPVDLLHEPDTAHALCIAADLCDDLAALVREGGPGTHIAEMGNIGPLLLSEVDAHQRGLSGIYDVGNFVKLSLQWGQMLRGKRACFRSHDEEIGTMFLIPLTDNTALRVSERPAPADYLVGLPTIGGPQ